MYFKTKLYTIIYIVKLFYDGYELYISEFRSMNNSKIRLIELYNRTTAILGIPLLVIVGLC